MRSNPTRKIMYWTVATLTVVAAGCGDDDGGSAATDAAESAYCDEAREWAIHEMEPVDDSDPAAFRAYWEDWVAFQEMAVDTAPEEIKDDWKLKFDSESETFTPILEKYDFDIAVMMESGTPEEEAAFEAPPEVQAAQDRILVYESEVCGAQQPLAADVSFEGEEAGPYCELVVAQDEQAAAALASNDPAEVEAVFDAMEETAPAITAAAPAVIKDDVSDLVAWSTGRQRDAAERHGYDLRAAISEGTPQDRAAINSADADIREQFARVAAYEEQVCYG